MKIVFTTFFRESMGGGAGRVAFEIAQAFAKNHEVLLICPGLKSSFKKVSTNLKELRISSLCEEDVAIPSLNIQNLKLIFNSLSKFTPDVIHAHDFGPLSLIAQFWAVNQQIPFVYTSHILPKKTSRFLGEASGFLGKIFDSNLFQKYFLDFFKGCDGLIALNQVVKKDFARFGFKENVFVIPNGRDLKAYQKQKATQINQKIKKLTFIGHICERKNQEYLLRVMKFLPKDYELNLVGKGLTPKNFQDLKQKIEKMKLVNVYLLGAVPHWQIPQILGQTHVFVSASKMEVHSLVVVEALASGTPVIGLANETIDELVDKQVGFRFAKKTHPQVFAQKIKEICSLTPKDYQKLCLNAKKRVAHLDWSKVTQQTVEVYRQLIILKKEQSQSQKEKHLKRLREILEFLPELKIKTFLAEQIEKPLSKAKKGNHLFILALLFTFIGGFLFRLTGGLRRLKGE